MKIVRLHLLTVAIAIKTSLRFTSLINAKIAAIKYSSVRRTLYLSLVKSNLCYACEVWSPYICSQKTKMERVQRRATRWILKARKGDSSYNERLVDLNLLPLCYDREIKDLMLFYKALYGISDLNVHDYVHVSFVTHNHSRLCRNPNLLLKTPQHIRTHISY